MPERQPHRLGLDGLSCREFLEGHSDYLDDLLVPERARWFDRHAAGCRSCQRYDRIVRQGLLLARNLPEVQPSAHFHEKLQARLMGLESEPPQRPVVANSSTVAVLAAALAVVALTPLLKLVDTTEPAVAAPIFQTIVPSTQSRSLVPRAAAAVVIAPGETSSFTPVVVQAPVWQDQPSAPRLVAYPMVHTSTR
jgi:hypothetical protein